VPGIIYFDLATETGYAAGSIRGVEAFGTFRLERTDENIGKFLNEADRKLSKLIDRFAPDLIGFESPFIHRQRDTIIRLRKLSGLANVVEQIADRCEIPCVEATTDEVCRNFCGRDYPRRSEAKKIAVSVRARDLGYQVANHNEADAVAGLHFLIALENPGKALELVPLFAKDSNLHG
jgi:Holliday junction resolvasome RuvABC endonuclease subunit